MYAGGACTLVWLEGLRTFLFKGILIKSKIQIQLADALTKPLPKDANMRIATLLLGQDFLAVQRIVEKLAGDIPVVQNINYASLHCGGV